MRDQTEFLQDKCRLLERSLKAASAKCSLRLLNLCELECPARSFCDVKGLIAISRRQDPDSRSLGRTDLYYDSIQKNGYCGP